MAFYRCGGPTKAQEQSDGFFLAEMDGEQIKAEPVQSIMRFNRVISQFDGESLDVNLLGNAFLGGSIIVPRVLMGSKKQINAVTLSWNRYISTIDFRLSDWSNAIDIAMSYRAIEWMGTATKNPLYIGHGWDKACTLKNNLHDGSITFYNDYYPAGGILTITPYIVDPNASVFNIGSNTRPISAFISEISDLLAYITISFDTSNSSLT